MSKIDKDTVVWITGASSGIGEEMVYQFASHDAYVIISSRRIEELERVKSQCPDPEKISILQVDLADADSLQKKGQEAIDIHGRIDILVNNGGISQRDKIINTDINVDRRLMEVNYFAAIALSKVVLPGMAERKRGHHVVMSSATGIISTPFRSSYAASKHALHGFYDALRAEHHFDDVKVSIICPGYIRTNISINALKGDGSKQNTMDEGQANGMTPEECVSKIISAVKKDKKEVYIGGFKEVMGIYIKRFIPDLFARIITKMATT